MAGAHCDLGEKITVYADKQLCSQLMPKKIIIMQTEAKIGGRRALVAFKPIFTRTERHISGCNNKVRFVFSASGLRCLTINV